MNAVQALAVPVEKTAGQKYPRFGQPEQLAGTGQAARKYLIAFVRNQTGKRGRSTAGVQIDGHIRPQQAKRLTRDLCLFRRSAQAAAQQEVVRTDDDLD